MTAPQRLVHELDQVLSRVRMTPEADQRILESLRSEVRRSQRPHAARWLVPATAFAVGVLLTFLLTLDRQAATPDVVQTVLPSALGQPECERVERANHLVLSGRCREVLRRAELSVETWNGAELQLEPDGARLIQGWATFDVEPISNGRPVRVYVSAGTIEVLGTRFVTYQELGGNGHVDLLEGRIRFIADGDEWVVHPGRRLGWKADGTIERESPVADPQKPPPEAAGSVRRPRKTPTNPTEKPTEPEATEAPNEAPPESEIPVERIARLRAAGRYEEAVEIIRQIPPRGVDRRTTEVLSFEEGSILQDHLNRLDQACHHWHKHLRRFPMGRYRDEVAQRIADLSCRTP